MTERTPHGLPWHLYDCGIGWEVHRSPGEQPDKWHGLCDPIVDGLRETFHTEANAEFIVRAANSHNALVGVVRWAIENIDAEHFNDDLESWSEIDPERDYDALMPALRAALAAATADAPPLETSSGERMHTLLKAARDHLDGTWGGRAGHCINGYHGNGVECSLALAVHALDAPPSEAESGQ